MNILKAFTLFSKFLIIAAVLLQQSACSESVEEEPLQSLANISEIRVLDNNNNGDASDIEVNFKKQTEANDRISSSFDRTTPQKSNLNERALTEDIFTVQGLVLSSNFTDTDGYKITDQESYIVSVLSIPKNKELFSEAFLKTTRPFQIKNHTQPSEVGMGSLTIDGSNNLYMATNNIISEINGYAEPDYPVFIISPEGEARAYSQPLSVLGGIDIDSEGNLYHSI